MCVTNANFTPDARSAVLEKPSIRLLTFRELEKDLFNYGQCLVEWCRQYENTGVFSATYTHEMVVDFIFGVYDLEDLVQRPLLLNMVVSTIIHGAIDISISHA